MKTIILCGGTGTRMKEETEFKPKPLVNVGGKPVLWHIMKIYAHYGYNEFILALGYKGDMIKEYFLNWRTLLTDFTLSTHDNEITFHGNGCDDFKITFVDTGLESLTGERVRRLKDYIGSDDFMVTYGDGVADIDLPALVAFHQQQGTIGTITGVHSDGRFGLLDHHKESGKIKNYHQANITPSFEGHPQDLINGGFMVFKNEFLDHLQPDTMIEEAFHPLAIKGELSMYEHPGKWKCMDTYKEVEDMNKFWASDPFWKVWVKPATQAQPAESQTIDEQKSAAPEPKPLVQETLKNNDMNNKDMNNNEIHKIEVKQINPSIAENFYKGKNVLVTGATGLVGGHVTEKLLARGANVFVTKRSNDPRTYFAQQGFNQKTVSAVCDIKDFSRVFDVISKYEIEYIFHIAAQPIVATAAINNREALETNIMGTVNILEAARQCPKIKGIVVASSDKAYGKKCQNADETAPMAGDHPYDVSKSCADLIARTFAKTYGLPVAVSRFGNIYGPGDLNMNRVVPGMMKALVNNEILELRSDGSFVRDYVYVKDVADGYLLLMENIDKVKGEAFNFSTGYNFSVLRLMEKISLVAGKGCKYVIANNQKNEIPSQSLNYDKVTQLLGWKSKYTFEEGMKETYDWYREYLSK